MIKKIMMTYKTDLANNEYHKKRVRVTLWSLCELWYSYGWSEVFFFLVHEGWDQTGSKLTESC